MDKFQPRPRSCCILAVQLLTTATRTLRGTRMNSDPCGKVAARIGLRYPRITVVERSGRRVGIYLAVLVRIEGCLVKRAAASKEVGRDHVRLPTKAGTDRNAPRDVPGILAVK